MWVSCIELQTLMHFKWLPRFDMSNASKYCAWAIKTQRHLCAIVLSAMDWSVGGVGAILVNYILYINFVGRLLIYLFITRNVTAVPTRSNFKRPKLFYLIHRLRKTRPTQIMLMPNSARTRFPLHMNNLERIYCTRLDPAKTSFEGFRDILQMRFKN